MFHSLWQTSRMHMKGSTMRCRGCCASRGGMDVENETNRVSMHAQFQPVGVRAPRFIEWSFPKLAGESIKSR